MAETVVRKMGLSGVLNTQDIRVRRNLRDMSFLYLSVLASFAFVVVVFVFLWSRLMVVNTGYEISKANSARAMLIEKNKRLKLEFMKLKAPQRIESIAAGELDLVRPTGEQIITVR